MPELDNLQTDLVALSMSVDLLWKAIVVKSIISVEDCSKIIEQHLLVLEEAWSQDSAMTKEKHLKNQRIRQLLLRTWGAIERTSVALTEAQNRNCDSNKQ